MNNSSKLLTLLLIIGAIFYSSSSHAQSLRKFSVGLNGGQGTTERGNGLALGLDVRYLVGSGKQLTFPVTFGYTAIRNKIQLDAATGKSGRKPKWDYFPLKIGIKAFFNKDAVGPYGLAEAGLGILILKEIGFYSSTIYSPAVGYAWRSGLDVAAKYEHSTWAHQKSGYLGVRMAYNF